MDAVAPIGCYPGTFDPPTIAHRAVAEAAIERAGLARLDLVVSRRTLGKEHLGPDSAPARAERLTEIVAAEPRLAVAVTDARLIVDVAAGYDVVVMGADKWRQVTDPAWYGDSIAARDAALVRLPRVLVVPRADDRPDDVDLLDVPATLARVSASAVRAGAPGSDGWRWTAR